MQTASATATTAPAQSKTPTRITLDNVTNIVLRTTSASGRHSFVAQPVAKDKKNPRAVTAFEVKLSNNTKTPADVKAIQAAFSEAVEQGRVSDFTKAVDFKVITNGKETKLGTTIVQALQTLADKPALITAAAKLDAPAVESKTRETVAAAQRLTGQDLATSK